MTKPFFLLLVISILVSCKTNTTEQWLKNKGLSKVESIVYDSQNEFFYTSSGKDYTVGTDGFISKISKDGKLIDLKWIEGLNRPTGMAVFNNQLYVADVNNLLIIDTYTAQVVKKIMEPIKNSGLNDVSTNQNGEIYVTGSFVHGVFKLERDSMVVWLQDDERLEWANGIIAEENRILVGGMDFMGIDIETKEVKPIETNMEVQDIDGISGDNKNGYYLTTVEGRSLFYMDINNEVTLLNSGGAYYGDLLYIPTMKRLFIPRGDHDKLDYFIEVINTP